MAKPSLSLDQLERLADLRSVVTQHPYDPDSTSDLWMADATCRKVDPELFHPGPNELAARRAALEKICAHCPVMQACRARRYTTGSSGWFAGVYYPRTGITVRMCAHSRCSKVAASPRTAYCGYAHEHAAKVGTRGGYELHLRTGVPACAPCTEGRRQAAQKYVLAGR